MDNLHIPPNPPSKCDHPQPYDPAIDADDVTDLDGINLDDGTGCPHCGGRRDNLCVPNAGYYHCETCGAVWAGDRASATLVNAPHSGPVYGGEKDDA